MKHLLLSLALYCSQTIFAQQVLQFREAADPSRGDEVAVWQKQAAAPVFGWGNADVHYAQKEVARSLSKEWKGSAWRGERISAQAVISTGETLHDVRMSVSDLRSGKHVIPASAVSKAFVRYVLTDSLVNGESGCGYRTDKSQYDSLTVADILDTRPSLDVAACTTRPLWMSIDVPATATPGLYKGTLTLTARDARRQERTFRLPFRLNVVARTLPVPAEWTFHLDLWQNPFAVARYYGVPLWSRQHFDLMRPLMERLAHSGQKVVTTTIMQRAWNGQTEDPFESMVMKMKRIDGSWAYDYAVFDRWVEFMMSCGIDRQINCYTVVPWSLSFDYFDQATNTVKHLRTNIGSKEYADYWTPFLKDFAAHLKQKGWFGRTFIALDERGMEETQLALDIVHAADPGFKISGAAHYYPEIEPRMDDLCMAYEDRIPDSVVERRRREGKLTTSYTCCSPARPNTFLVSEPFEAALLPVCAVANGFDGYLRWAYNSWTRSPLEDARFRTWVGGDCFLVYPGASSIRMERLREGIADAEKIRILREKFEKGGNARQLKRLNEAVGAFSPQNVSSGNGAEMLRRLRELLNTL